MTRAMWCDNFDMDLPTVIPEALGALGDLADVQLFTHGIPDRRFGTLNHPRVWNRQNTMLAFFGFRDPSKPPTYWTDAPIVSCTVWEAYRDAWCHHLCIIVQGSTVWDTFALGPQFEELVYHVRGWRYSKDPERIEREVLQSIALSAQRLRDLTTRHAAHVRRFTPHPDPLPHPSTSSGCGERGAERA